MMKETTGMKIGKRAHPSRLKEWHQSPIPTATSSAIGKSQTENKYGDFSNPVKSPENTKGCPKLLHHNTNKPRQAALCMRFQCHGKCNSDCNFLHLEPNKIPKAIKDEITSRLLQIFA
jgi:hypothetical protein